MLKTSGRSKRAMSLAAASAVGLSAFIGFAAPAQAAEPTTIQLLTINDFHGRLANVPGSATTPEVPGAAKLFGLINSLRDDLPTSVVAAGDLIGASTFPSAIDDDNPTIDVMNAGGLTASSVGNHEFDKGYDDLVNRVIPRAEYPYLGANVYLNGQHALDSYYINEVGGLKVGYVGVVTVQTPTLVSPDGIVGLSFTDPVLEANKVAAQLKDGDASNGEADIVVLMAHEGAAEDSVAGGCLGVYGDSTFTSFTHSSAAIDAIVSGHTHQSYAYEMPVPGMAKTRPVIQANQYSQRLGKITLTFDGNTVTNSTAELLDPATSAPDPTVAAIVATAVTNSTVLGAAPVGSVTAEFPVGIQARGNEWAINNLVASGQLDQTSAAGRGGAEVAFVNPGGVRAGITYAGPEGAGVVTYSEAFAVQPFSNDVVTVTLTGAQILDALKQQVQPFAVGGRPYLHLGNSNNFTYSYRYLAATAGTPGAIDIIDPMLNGAPLNPAASYRVTINSFLAAGGDNFPAFALGTAKITTGDNDLTMLTNYLAANPGLNPGDYFPLTTVAPGVPAGGVPGGPVTPPAPLTPADCPAAVATAAVALSVTTAKPGDTIHVVGTDFAPYETVSATLFSEPLAVGTSVASADGVVEFDVVLGDTILAGDHSVQLIGLGSDINVSAAFVVEALPILAATGGQEQQALTVGLLLVLLGAMALYAGRRRRFDLAA